MKNEYIVIFFGMSPQLQHATVRINCRQSLFAWTMFRSIKSTCRQGCRRTVQSGFEKFGDSPLHANGAAGLAVGGVQTRVAGRVARRQANDNLGDRNTSLNTLT
ncbi:hypothetical protein L596_027019 [Steinernema carpocapsae]|uniref:Uncharacterized protein n=1 Tax=Steinernema carpocapsae TaxID=34508 RepID=A0A4U5M400_STECR|nr:hypothetical protein L596_027019 [Steinernema carpocapsae]